MDETQSSTPVFSSTATSNNKHSYIFSPSFTAKTMKSIVTVVAASLAFALAQGSLAPSSLSCGCNAECEKTCDYVFHGMTCCGQQGTRCQCSPTPGCCRINDDSMKGAFIDLMEGEAFKADLMEGSDDFFDDDHSDNFSPQPAHPAYAASDNKLIHSAEEFGALGPDTEVLTVDDELMGLGDINTTVINGYPTNGSIFRGTVHLSMGCTGSFISPNLVLSAAHCYAGRSQTGIRVSGGARAGQVDFGSSRRHASRQYQGTNKPNDICLIQLQSSKPSSYPHYDMHAQSSGNHLPVGSYIAGYGLNSSSAGSGTARYGLTSISGYRNYDVLVRARPGTSPQQNSCNGDSGGPLLSAIPGSNLWLLHGATSRGANGCPVSQSVSYVNTVPNVSWLRSTASSWGLSDLNGHFNSSPSGGGCSTCCYSERC